VIIVTASEDEADGVRVLEMGADDYISEPIKTVNIFSAIVRKHVARAEELKLKRAGYSVGA
jgi:DNA-binding response OmpR family regulator